jgi:hypothetical protein
MGGPGKALLISETGWRGIKEFSSPLVKSGFSVDIVIKGRVDRRILEIITRPGGVRIRAVPREFFIAHIFFYILLNRAAGRLKMAVISKEKTGGWIRLLGVKTKLLVETKDGYCLK